MATELTEAQWRDLGRQLQAAFDPKDVDFRVQGRASEQTGKAQVIAYIDARAVQDRLDSVVGPGAWAFDWTPVVVDKGEVMVAKGTITIHGVAKSDAGSASNFEQSLGAVSHCFKRTAVQWGVGRYLYNLPMNWVPVEKNGRIPDATLRELRSKLPRPDGQQATQQATQQRQAPATTATTLAPVATPDEPPATAPAPAPKSSKQDAIDRLAELRQQQAPAQRQHELAESLRKQDYGTVATARTFLTDVLHREFDPVALKRGVSDITLGECLEVEKALIQPTPAHA